MIYLSHQRGDLMDFGEKVKQLRTQQGLTLEDVGNAVGVGKSTVRKWESGIIANMRRDKIALLAKALHVSPSYLMGWNDNNSNDPSPVDSTFQGSIRIPILGTIPAGIPLEAIEDIVDWEEIPASMSRGGKEYFGLKVTGDSMSPRYEDGDVLILRKQDSCESGQDCAVMVGSSDATFKRVRFGPSGVTLHPLNPNYETYHYTKQEVVDLPVRILGVVVEMRRKI